jgi:uncharacterized iron-regulated protein
MMIAPRRGGPLLLLMLVPAACSLAEQPKDAGDGGVWIDVYRGEPLRCESLLSDLAAADVIYLGEYHTVQRHHAVQAEILAGLARRAIPLALGLEQMESWQQPSLDRYNRGEIDFAQLAEATGWPKRWKNYRQYQPVLEAARKAKAETIRQVVHSGGVAGMSAEARKGLPAEMRLQDPVYEKLLALQMVVHVAATPEVVRPMIEAQMARDEAMAEALAEYAKSGPGRGRKVLVLCGVGHVAYGLGMPARVRRRLPGVRDRIILLSESGEVRLSPEETAQARELEITHQQLREINLPVADYLGVKPLAAEPGLPPARSRGT